MRRHANRPHARPAAAVRNAESFVQVQMADVRAHVTRPAKSDLRVHIRAVHVNLPAVGMDDFANLADGFLKNTMRRRISNHQRRQFLLMRLRLGLEVGDVDVAFLVAAHRNHLQPGHDLAV